MEERGVVSCLLLKSPEYFPKAVKPRMGSLNDPSSRLEVGILFLFRYFFSSWSDMRGSSISFNGLSMCLSRISGVKTEILFLVMWRKKNSFLDHFRQFGDIVFIRPADDEREWGTTLVGEQVSFDSVFSPDPLGSPQRIPVPREPCSSPHRHSAIPI